MVRTFNALANPARSAALRPTKKAHNHTNKDASQKCWQKHLPDLITLPHKLDAKYAIIKTQQIL